MTQHFDTIVIGLGGLGSAAAYWLARRGSRVLGLEQFEIGHVRGESEDHSRIIRLSYHTPGYVELARAAYEAWTELEADSGEKVVYRTGGLDLFPDKCAIPKGDYVNSMTACGVAFEELTAAETMARWPQFRLEADTVALYQSESGISAAAKANAAHRRMALHHGATLRDNAPVTSVRAAGEGLEVVAGGERFACDRLIIAAGPWSNNILTHFGRKLHLTITQEQVTYFSTPHLAEFMPDRFPIWIWMDEPSFYGFPAFGEPGPKAAQDVGGRPVTADTRSFEPDPENAARVLAFMRRVLPGAVAGEPLLTKTCLYTMPPDRDFVLSTLPEQPNVSIAIGAGHAFKFAGLIGRILSDLALDGETRHDLSPFHIDRPILLEANPVTSFMV